MKQLIDGVVIDFVYKQKEGDPLLAIDIDDLDPISFEQHCSNLLTRSGWTSRVTKASGDQGIDIIAMYGNVKVVFQCKKYSSPVGNAAVQEIF